MEAPVKGLSWPKELGQVFLVAVGVTLVFTLAASLFDRFHQVAAEDLRHQEETATPGGNNTQLLTFKEWGVSLSVPLGVGLPAVTYVAEGPDSFGLSSADVESAGRSCSASQNAIGAVVRVPAGDQLSGRDQLQMSLGTVGDYRYLYDRPQSACAATEAAVTASREAIMIEGDATLSPVLVSR